MNKIEARKYAIKIRKELDSFKSSKELLEKIYSNCIIDKYENIGIYYPLKYEIDIVELVEKYPNKKFYLPVTKEEIHFVRYKENDILVDGPFNTKEPIGDSIDINSLDCILIPCLAISKDKKRLGYGKGYYDRALANYKGIKIGICYQMLNSLNIDMDDYDLILDYVL